MPSSYFLFPKASSLQLGWCCSCCVLRLVIWCAYIIIICGPLFTTLLEFLSHYMPCHYPSSASENVTAGSCKKESKTVTFVYVNFLLLLQAPNSGLSERNTSCTKVLSDCSNTVLWSSSHKLTDLLLWKMGRTLHITLDDPFIKKHDLDEQLAPCEMSNQSPELKVSAILIILALL